eukprot:g3312.t1
MNAWTRDKSTAIKNNPRKGKTRLRRTCQRRTEEKQPQHFKGSSKTKLTKALHCLVFVGFRSCGALPVVQSAEDVSAVSFGLREERNKNQQSIRFIPGKTPSVSRSGNPLPHFGKVPGCVF